MTSPYPTPYFISPIISPPTHCFLFLHGLGSNGQQFGDEFLAAKNSIGETLREAFPRMKFVFPTARKGRITVFKRMKLNHWFDVASMDDKTSHEEIEIDGLSDTSEFIRQLIDEEVKNGVPSENIILGGISQGFAASIYALFTLERRIGAYIGMSGWLPFVKDIEKIMSDDKAEFEADDSIDIVFAHDDDIDDNTAEGNEVGPETPSRKADRIFNKSSLPVEFLRENIGLDSLNGTSNFDSERMPLILRIPIFLGHGVKDEKVSIIDGRRTSKALQSMGMSVISKEYGDLGHWYKVPDEIDDIATFIKNSL